MAVTKRGGKSSRQWAFARAESPVEAFCTVRRVKEGRETAAWNLKSLKRVGEKRKRGRNGKRTLDAYSYSSLRPCIQSLPLP
jgi:hypothetical protein